MIMIFVTVMYAIIILACIIAALRNNAVLNERLRILDRINEINRAEIVAGKDYDGWRYREFMWRYREFMNGPSHEEMVYRFWVPVTSFYQNHPCLEIQK